MRNSRRGAHPRDRRARADAAAATPRCRGESRQGWPPEGRSGPTPARDEDAAAPRAGRLPAGRPARAPMPRGATAGRQRNGTGHCDPHQNYRREAPRSPHCVRRTPTRRPRPPVATLRRCRRRLRATASAAARGRRPCGSCDRAGAPLPQKILVRARHQATDR